MVNSFTLCSYTNQNYDVLFPAPRRQLPRLGKQ